MQNNDFEARVRNRIIKFPSVDGLTPIELSTIVGQVEEKINKIEQKLNIVDSSKLAILAAYDFAVELYNLRQKSETDREADSRKVEELVEKLACFCKLGFCPFEKLACCCLAYWCCFFGSFVFWLFGSFVC